MFQNPLSTGYLCTSVFSWEGLSRGGSSKQHNFEISNDAPHRYFPNRRWLSTRSLRLASSQTIRWWSAIQEMVAAYIYDQMSIYRLHSYPFVLILLIKLEPMYKDLKWRRRNSHHLFLWRQVHGCLLALPRRRRAKGCECGNNGNQDGKGCRLCQLVPNRI